MIYIFEVLLIISGFFFVDPNQNYSVLLPDGMQLVQVDTLANELVNYTFADIDQIDSFDYSLSFAIVLDKGQNLYKEGTILQYEEDCSCKVLGVEKVQFNNFRGVRYTIEREVEDVLLGGKVYISEVQNNKSINVVSMTLKDHVKHLDRNLEPILNTLVLNFE